MAICIQPLVMYMQSYGKVEAHLHELQPIYVNLQCGQVQDL